MIRLSDVKSLAVDNSCSWMDVAACPADIARIGFWYAGSSFQTLFSARGLEVCFKHIVVVVCGTGP